MSPKLTGLLALITLLVSVLWIAFFILGLATAGPWETFDQVLAWVVEADALFYLTYINATLIPVAATATFAAFYVEFRQDSPTWAAVGAALLPVYATLSFLAYFSQITVVPYLVDLHRQPEFRAAAEFALRLTVQGWPGSAVWVFNNLAYGVLGIPSIIFGILLAQRKGIRRWGGAFLALNGLACLGAVVGVVSGDPILQWGSVVGGVLFILALIGLSWGYLSLDRA